MAKITANIQIPDCVSNSHPNREYEIEFVFPEFTCINPETKFPEFATVSIQYIPFEDCLDTVSLKKYLNGYREEEIYSHTAVNRILDDLVRACQPREMSVTGDFTVRGGISTSVSARYSAGDSA